MNYAWAAVAALSLGACYVGADDSGLAELEDSESSGSSSSGGDAGEESGDGDGDGDGDGEPPQTYPEEDCEYTLVHEQPGPVHTVSASEPNLDVMPLAEGAGFYCLRVEFDLDVPDDLPTLLAVHEGCPEYLALASAFGTQATGDYLATSFFHAYELADEQCDAREASVEVGNYIDYSAGIASPWLPGHRWHVVLEAKPWLTRIDVEGEDASAHRVEASLFPANVADTRDPVVRLGQPQVTGDMFYPWFGAQYSNLRIEAVVAPPP